MKTITSENSRFPNPEKSVPNLVIVLWGKKRLEELSQQPSTPAIEQTIGRLNKLNSGEAIVEPPVIIDDNFVRICIISRAAQTLWFDEKVERIEFDQFLSAAFPDGAPNSVIARDEPYTIAELEELIRSERSVPIPGYINVKDTDGSIKKVIIADVLDEKTVHRENLFGEFVFEKSTTDIYGFDGDDRPTYPFKNLNDLSLAVTTIKDTFFKSDVVIHSIAINLLRSMITEYETPPKITKAVVAGDNTIDEVSDVANIDITNSLMVTTDKPANKDDLQVVSLEDEFGNVIDPKAYTTRVLATTDPKVLNVEISLNDYQRRFFAPDEVGKAFSFSVDLKIKGNEQATAVVLSQVWKNAGNTHEIALVGFDKSFKGIDKFPLNLSLISRATKKAVADLTPLKLVLDNTFDMNYGMPPTLVDDKYVLGTSDGNATIAFNLKQDEYGQLNLSFTDSRIVPSRYLIADPKAEYGVSVDSSVYDKDAKTITFSQRLTGEYGGSIGSIVKVVYEYKDVKIAINGAEPIPATVKADANVGNSAVDFTVPYEGDDRNLNCVITGTIIVGINSVSVPMSSDYLHNLVLLQILSTVNGKDGSIGYNAGQGHTVGEAGIVTNIAMTGAKAIITEAKENDAILSGSDNVPSVALIPSDTDATKGDLAFGMGKYFIPAFASSATPTRVFAFKGKLTGDNVDPEKCDYAVTTTRTFRLPADAYPMVDRVASVKDGDITLTFGLAKDGKAIPYLQPEVRDDYSDMLSGADVKVSAVGKVANNKIALTFKTSKTGVVPLNFVDPRIAPAVLNIAGSAAGWVGKADAPVVVKAADGTVTYSVLIVDKDGKALPFDAIQADFKKANFTIGGVAATSVETKLISGANPGVLVTAHGDTSGSDVKVAISGVMVIGDDSISVNFSQEDTINPITKITDVTVPATQAITVNTDKKYTVGTGSVITMSADDVDAGNIEITKMLDGSGLNITKAAVLTATAVAGDKTKFDAKIDLSNVVFPMSFSDPSGVDGNFDVTYGIKGNAESVKAGKLPYKLSRAAASMRPWIRKVTLGKNGKDDAVIDVAFLNETGACVAAGINQTFPADYKLYADSADNQLSYLGDEIKYGADSEGTFVASIKTKIDKFGNFLLAFNDKAFQTARSSIADPAGTYELRPLKQVVDESTKTITLQYELYKDGAKYTIYSGSILTTDPIVAKVDGTEKMVGGDDWTYDKVEAGVLSLNLYVDDVKVDHTYDVKGNFYIGANNVKVPFADAGTVKGTGNSGGGDDNGGNGGDTDPVVKNPTLTDKDGKVIEDGSTIKDNAPSFGGTGMKPGSTVTITDNGEKIGEATVGEDGTWSYKPDPALKDGEHKLDVTGTDADGKPTTGSTTVTVDTTGDDNGGGGDDTDETAEDKALADPTEGGKYSGPGESGFGSTMETYPEVTEAKPAYNLSATPIVMVFPYVEKGSID